MNVLATLLGGLTHASVWSMVIYTLVTVHVTIVTVSVYLHRHSAHRAVELHPALQHFFRFWLWIATGMTTKAWTAIHRKHHVVTETEEDPHSPQIYGLKKVLLEGAELYRIESAKTETLERFGKGTPDDWLERHVYTPHASHGIALLAIVDILLFGAAGLTIWAVQMIWIPFFAAGVINGIGHYWGYRNFECPDAATNIFPWGILIGGEELHNNHHTYPNSAKFSVKPWEFDIGWVWIRLFQMLGLAKPLSTGPVVARVEGKESIDLDTVWAVLNDRFRVMAQYAERVVAPLVEQERGHVGAAAQKLMRRAKALLTREETLVDERGRADITTLVRESAVLKLIYEKRLELQRVWARRGGDSAVLLAEFKRWCQEAEASGIQVLKDFAAELRSYTIPTLAHA